MKKSVMPMEERSAKILSDFERLSVTLSLFKLQIGTLNQQMIQLKRDVAKELKVIEKQTLKTKAKVSVIRPPSGISKPTQVSEKLCTFMNLSLDSKIARTEVTKYLSSYIKENKLQNTDGKKTKIIADDKLNELLGLSPEEKDNLTFFNLQKYMNVHFVKSGNNSSAGSPLNNTIMSDSKVIDSESREEMLSF